jgi:uncharacterized protein YbaR (Trm112 family)/ubiquinone/menaquinone biosynthesis C-methylase UbiE
MHATLLEILRCPICRGTLALDGDGGHDIESGTLTCHGCGALHPIIRGIPRFVPADNYSASFGYQWNRFPRTQLDSYSGTTITADRFFSQSGWTSEEMRAKSVLDVGCGAGRFAEVTLGTGARVVAVDYSSAVDACRANLGGAELLDVVQADVYHLPFAEEAFDFVYCFGVVQHTPDVKAAVQALVGPTRRGGRVAVDVYPKLWLNFLWPKYWLRPLTKRIPHQRLFPIIEKLVAVLLPLSRLLRSVPMVGRKLRWLVPVANYEGVHPLDERQVYEWAVLDTFDMFAPAHDHPQEPATLRRWLTEAGVDRVEVLPLGHLVGRGVRGNGGRL